MKKLKRITIVLAAAVFVISSCEKGMIPVLITDAVEGIDLPQYTPPDSDGRASIVDPYKSYGADGTRINHSEMNIKYAYNSSDEVTHIILRGNVNNGIPEGLLWNESIDGAFGVPSGTYGGRGDFKVGTLNALRPEATGGSVAIGSPDFSSEWMMGGFYTAVVIDGIIDNIEGVAVTETNESLRLFSEIYRKAHYPDEATFFEVDGKMQRKNRFTYNPNDFHPWPDPDESIPPPYNIKSGAPRGGYYILISEKADPPTAILDIEYKDGSKKKIEIDYSEVELREKVALTDLALQSPTPATSDAGTYSLFYTTLPSQENPFIGYTVYHDDNPVQPEPGVYFKDIFMNLATGNIDRPLYLRPLYAPVNIDPMETTTNMISKVYAKDTEGNNIRDSNLRMEWDDTLQAINVYYIGNKSDTYGTEIVVYAVLKEPAPISSLLDPSITVSGIACHITLLY
ncbi:MAG: hypothetical protein LBC27_10550 [Spirochaetaceae bacterium]|jgi:hypothetical protein|nr:hypothetical protein [Spirochaetaceae bacterium]